MQSLDQIRKIYLKIFGNSCGIAQITNLAESCMAFRLLDRFGSQRFMSGCPKHIFKIFVNLNHFKYFNRPAACHLLKRVLMA